MSTSEAAADRHCPGCGASWDHVTDVSRRLSELGYTSDDRTHECLICGERWTHGKPVGDSGLDGHRCPVDGERMLAHKFDPSANRFVFKCPGCYFVKFEDGIRLNNDEILTGYPAITGELQ